MRVLVLYIFILTICLYAYRDWFKALCGLILLVAVVMHPDFPYSIGGIQGLNPWNVALANVMAGWLIQRRREGAAWDLPPLIGRMLIVYLVVVLIGFARCLLDGAYVATVELGDLISERLVNCVKWVIPGLLLFDGCRDRKRLAWALTAILGMYFLLAVQVIRWMPASEAASGAELAYRSRKLILNEVGFHPVNMSMMLAGACWATLAAVPLAKRTWMRVFIVLVALAIAYGQALTGGRMGYVTWGVVGLIMGLLRWRKYLLLAPIMVIAIGLAVPSAVERMLSGFSQKTASGEEQVSDYQITSGRTLIWPYVIDKIMESPIIGYGRLGMDRTGLSARLWNEMGESFPHPHNAYLEWLLDNGIIGFLLVMPFYVLIVFQSARLFVSRAPPPYVAAGAMCLSLVLALLVAAMGSQTFYPREGSVGMWAAIGLMWRASVVWRQSLARGGFTAQPGSAGYRVVDVGPA